MKSLIILTVSLLVLSAAEPNGIVGNEDAGMDADVVDDGEDAPIDFSSEITGEEFIPTNEWQKVEQGQAIPRGLHVRLNLQTGVREAKLLDESEESDSEHTYTHTVSEPGQSALTVSEDESEAEDAGSEAGSRRDSSAAGAQRGYHYFTSDDSGYESDGSQFSREELKEALKNFKATKLDTQTQERVMKFRNINELKAEFEKMDMDIETDTEILSGLMGEYRLPDLATERKLNILTDLEYLVHQIDNAKDFVSMGGLDFILRDLNDTDEFIRSEAAFVLGSATQSNPQVQVMAIETGLLHQLLRMISAETADHLRSRLLFALSSVVRHFPYAQQKFVEFGGLHTLSSLFSKPGPDKLKIKAVTLVTDLLMEKIHAEQYLDPGNPTESEKLHQYNLVPLINHLKEQRWCIFLTDLLGITGHDHREKVLTAMSTLLQTCKTDFLQNEAVASLSYLIEEYKTLAEEERSDGDTDEYFNGLLQTVTGLLIQLGVRDEL